MGTITVSPQGPSHFSFTQPPDSPDYHPHLKTVASPLITASSREKKPPKTWMAPGASKTLLLGTKLELAFAQSLPHKLWKTTAGSEHWLQKKGGQREDGKEERSQGQAVHGEDRSQAAGLDPAPHSALLCTPGLGNNPEPHELWSRPGNSSV